MSTPAPTPAQIRNAVETRMRALLLDLIQKQTVHRAMTGKFWQGARTHTITPKDGATAAPNLAAKVNGEPSWTQLGVTLPDIECAFEVSAYSGPRGEGWTLTATVELNGDTYQKVANVGPEDGRVTGWQKLQNGGA